MIDTLVILFMPVTLVTLFRSYNQFYRVECITVSGFFFFQFWCSPSVGQSAECCETGNARLPTPFLQNNQIMKYGRRSNTTFRILSESPTPPLDICRIKFQIRSIYRLFVKHFPQRMFSPQKNMFLSKRTSELLNDYNSKKIENNFAMSQTNRILSDRRLTVKLK